MRFTEAAPDAIPVEVTENQFVFNFRYRGPGWKIREARPETDQRFDRESFGD